MPTISPHAIVKCPENLAADVVVEAFAYVGAQVRLGPGSHVGNNVTIDGDVRIGANNRIYPYAVIGQVADPDVVGAGVTLGDRNCIREHSVIQAGTRNGGTRIGSDNLLMTGCYVGPDVVIEDLVVLGNYSQLSERTHVERHVWAAAFTGADAGVTIGRYSFTSGYAGIDRDAPPYAVLQGFPFRVRGANVVKLKRCAFDETTIGSLKAALRTLYNGESGEPSAEALKNLAVRDDLNEHVRYLVDYLRRHDGQADAGTD